MRTQESEGMLEAFRGCSQPGWVAGGGVRGGTQGDSGFWLRALSVNREQVWGDLLARDLLQHPNSISRSNALISFLYPLVFEMTFFTSVHIVINSYSVRFKGRNAVIT